MRTHKHTHTFEIHVYERFFSWEFLQRIKPGTRIFIYEALALLPAACINTANPWQPIDRIELVAIFDATVNRIWEWRMRRRGTHTICQEAIDACAHNEFSYSIHNGNRCWHERSLAFPLLLQCPLVAKTFQIEKKEFVSSEYPVRYSTLTFSPIFSHLLCLVRSQFHSLFVLPGPCYWRNGVLVHCVLDAWQQYCYSLRTAPASI